MTLIVVSLSAVSTFDCEPQRWNGFVYVKAKKRHWKEKSMCQSLGLMADNAVHSSLSHTSFHLTAENLFIEVIIIAFAERSSGTIHPKLIVIFNCKNLLCSKLKGKLGETIQPLVYTTTNETTTEKCNV